MLCTGFVLPTEKMGVKGESVVETQQKNRENEDRTSDKGKHLIILHFVIYIFCIKHFEDVFNFQDDFSVAVEKTCCEDIFEFYTFFTMDLLSFSKSAAKR